MARTAESNGPMDRLKSEAGGLAEALTKRAVSAARDKVVDATGRLTEYAENGGGSGLTAALTGAKDLAEGKSPARSLLGAGTSGLKDKVSGLFGGGKKGKSRGAQKLKVTNIVESIDVGVPVRVAYDQWTQFSQFPTFMKKVENVEQAEDEKLNWKAQVFWSHRTWEATILDQRPDERIVWRSKGDKGHVDGAVTFHEVGPNLTRIILVLEYHPQGLFEQTGNLWRAQGRRVRLELKHFRRHVMMQTMLHTDELEGWRGVIEDSEVVKDQETAVREEQEQEQGQDESGQDEQGSDESAEYDEESHEEEDENADEEEPAAEDESADEEPEPEEPEEEPAAEERPSRRRQAPRKTEREGSTARAGKRTTRSSGRRTPVRGGNRK